MRILSFILLPLAWIYDGVTRLRNLLFDCGVWKQRHYDVPMMAVGNLAVGGTGKTPHTEYLLRLLSSKYRTAVLSRGYGRKSRGYQVAEGDISAEVLGDEPLQMHRKFPDVTVAVCEDRCAGAGRLLQRNPAPEVLVLDDAYQHRHIRAGLYLLLTDYSRLYSSDLVLPAGRLRESRRGSRRADIIVVTKCPPGMSEKERDGIIGKLAPLPRQSVYFSTMAYGRPYPLFSGTSLPDEEVKDPVNACGKSVFLLSGIAHPEPLSRHLEERGCSCRALRFPDHHRFTASDFAHINEMFAAMPPGTWALTTEKDAARLLDNPSLLDENLRRNLWVQPIEVKFLFGQEQKFQQQILYYVTTHSRNRCMD